LSAGNSGDRDGEPARGTYYAFDVNAGAPTGESVTRLQVLDDRDEDHRNGDGDGPDDVGRGDLARVSLTSSDRFVVRGHLPARGSVLVRNMADTTPASISFAVELDRRRPQQERRTGRSGFR